jgi:hypothetical protein
MPGDQEILKVCHEFYLLTGTAATALVALLFVAASIGAGYLSPERAAASRVFISPVVFSPVVFHFTSILFLSLVILVLAHAHVPPALLIAVNAGIGAVGSVFIFMRVMSDNRADWIDRIGYGAAPVIAYTGALLAAVLLTRKSVFAGDVLAAAVVLLLLANIRNAWDLTLAMARSRSAPKDDDGQQLPRFRRPVANPSFNANAGEALAPRVSFRRQGTSQLAHNRWSLAS